jgi:putative aldouronate transport system permease protein
LIPKELSPESYLYLWGERIVILKALFVSVAVTIIGTLIGVTLTTSMGYVLSRKNYKLNGFVSWLVFIPMVFNGGLVATYVINTNLLGFKNVIWALILPLAVSSFNVIICRTFFATTIPDSLIESAKIDGATQLKIFIRIVLPISKPVIATIGIFLCFNYWNDWFQSSLYISNKDLFSLQALLNNIQRNIEFLANNPSAGLSLQQYVNTMPQEGVRMAMAIVILIPIACAYPFFQKYFISGLTVGAIKG